MDNLPKLYRELADWFHLLTAPSSYVDEADFIRRTLDKFCIHKPKTLLELGSGGGNNASHLKQHFTMTLVDPSPGMLAISQGLNPEYEHVQGDMRDVRLGRPFDAVFIHDAIMYITTLDDLRRVMATAYAHCRAGGVVHVLPDCIRETFEAKTEHGGHDGEGRGVRYVSWTHDPDETDSTYIVDMGYLLRETSSGVRAVHDRHVFGFFAKGKWLEVINEAGFAASVVTDDPHGRETFVGVKPQE